jgi:hypothetical protein
MLLLRVVTWKGLVQHGANNYTILKIFFCRLGVTKWNPTYLLGYASLHPTYNYNTITMVYLFPPTCTRFFDCDLRGTTTKMCDFTSTNFTRCNLQDAKWGGSAKDPCEYWDVIRHDGVFVPGFTFDLYIAERIAESETRGNDVF